MGGSSGRRVISVVVACRKPEDAQRTFRSFAACGNEMESVAVHGAAVLDAYRDGQTIAKGRYTVYTHEDVICLQSGLELAFDEIWKRHPHLGWIGLCGNTLPLACALHWHALSSTVGNTIVGWKGHEDLVDFSQFIMWPGIRWGAINMAAPVKLLDAAFLVTRNRDWNFEQTCRESFLGVYDGDISYEAIERGRGLLAVPLHILHFSTHPNSLDRANRIKEQFGPIDGTRFVERWRDFTVPCEDPSCRLSVVRKSMEPCPA